jgi:hypothetical protein
MMSNQEVESWLSEMVDRETDRALRLRDGPDAIFLWYKESFGPNKGNIRVSDTNPGDGYQLVTGERIARNWSIPLVKAFISRHLRKLSILAVE